MAFLKSEDDKELLIDDDRCCDEGIRFRICEEDKDYYVILSYTNGNFYRDQGDSIFEVIYRKLKKILAIIRNEDFYYSEVIISKKDFEIFKNYINKF